MRRILSVAIAILLTIISYSQVQEAWTKGISFIYTSPDRACLALGPGGNIYTGVRTYDFGPGIGLEPTIMIKKFNPNGTEIFSILEPVEEFTSTLVDMAVDASGNVYCAVHITRTLDPSEPRIGGAFAVYKYSSTGSVLWKTIYSDGEYSLPTALALDAAGNVYLTGGCRVTGLQSDIYYDYLTVKWNAAGERQWARRYDGASPGDGFNIANDVAVDASGNVYITGASQLDGLINYATIKYDASGTEKWVQRYTGTGTGDDRAVAITLDISGFVYVTGSSEGAIATVKYNNDGAQLWVAREGSTGAAGRAVKVDASGGVYVAGNSTSTQSALIKYGFNGAKMWMANRNNADAYSLALDVDGNPYIGGSLNDDGLVEKYNSQGVSQWFKVHDSPLLPGRNSPVVVSNNYNVYVESFVSTTRDGNATARYSGSLIKYTQCNVICPSNITVNTDPGKCDAVVNFADAVLTGDCGATLTYSHASGATFPIGTTKVTVASDATGVSCTFTITVIDNQNPVITNCPSNKLVSANPGVCYATAASVNVGVASASDNCNPVGVVGVRNDGASLSANYPVGITTIVWTATDPSNNKTTCSQTVTVVDTEKPTISIQPKSVNTDPGKCYATLALTDLGTATVSDNCTNGLVVTAPTLPANNQFPKGITNLTWQVTDASGNTATAVQVVTVTDNEPPKIENLSATPEELTPPNHKMRDVIINYTVSDNCAVASYSITRITSNEAVNAPGSGNTSPDWEYVDAHNVKLRAERAANGDGRIYTITIRCTDVSGNSTERTVEVYVNNNAATTNANNKMIVAGEAKSEQVLEVVVAPNPTKNYFSLYIKGSSGEANIMLQVIDQYGRVIETRNNAPVGSTVRFGHLYRPGVYYVRMLQGKVHKEVKLVKLN